MQLPWNFLGDKKEQLRVPSNFNVFYFYISNPQSLHAAISWIQVLVQKKEKKKKIVYSKFKLTHLKPMKLEILFNLSLEPSNI